MVDELSQLPKYGYQNTTREFNYIILSISKMYDIDKLPGGNFSITFKIIDQYQRKYPGKMYKCKCEIYKYAYFCVVINTIS